MPLCDATSGCDFYYNVAGNIHYDTASTCANDSLRPAQPITNMKVRLKQGGSVIQQFYTFNSGGYSFKTPSFGTYTVDIDTTALPISVVCPQSGTRSVAITAIDSVKKYENFGMQCSAIDFGVIDMYEFRFRPTFQTTVHINAGNIALLKYNANCGAGTAGTVVTTFTNAMTYISPAPGALTPTSVSGNTITYNLADLNTLHSGSLDIILQTGASAVPGTSSCITTTVTPSVQDLIPANNTLTQCFPILNSWDPNHKDVSPTRLTNAATSDWLTYTIHFQNTGTDTAYLVVLKDTLSNFVDAASFQYLASSHHAVIQLDHSAMAFTFPHINLVDSATNPPLSEGWIQYRVKANSNLTNGTAINNTAYIYFDNNPAVVTNTATTTVTLVTCSDTTISQSQAICAGDTFTFYGQQLTTQGTYSDTMPRAGGCDSIVSLTLTLNQPDMTMIEDTICSGSSYTFHGQSLTAAGMYMDTLQNIHGCDSVIMLMLGVRASDTTRVADTICSGTSYSFYGRTLTAAGTYTDTLRDARGCDSLIMLSLALRPAPVVTWTQIDTSLFAWCISPPPLPLINALPRGGHFSGAFVSNDSIIAPYHAFLDTTFIVVYTYSDSNSCMSSVSKVFHILVGCEGINDIADLNAILLYPNPNTGAFTLQTSNSHNSSYVITDVLGHMIAEKTITSDTQGVDMTEAAAGVYTLTVKGLQSSRQVRFVVVRQ